MTTVMLDMPVELLRRIVRLAAVMSAVSLGIFAALIFRCQPAHEYSVP